MAADEQDKAEPDSRGRLSHQRVMNDREKKQNCVTSRMQLNMTHCLTDRRGRSGHRRG